MRGRAAFLGALAASLLATACGSDDGGVAATATTTPTRAAPTSAAPTTTGAPPTTTAPTTTAPTTTGAPPTTTAAPRASLITANSIGPLRVGMTFGEIKAALGPDWDFSDSYPFLVDFEGVDASLDGEVHFHIVYGVWEAPLVDGSAVTILVTRHPRYQTAEGVGAGTTLVDAEAAYGEATLSFNTSGESREYVRFESHPFPRLSFRPDPAGGHVGVYPPSTDEFQETTDYVEGATIDWVELTCVPPNCS